MAIEKIRNLVSTGKIRWRVHVTHRMRERGIAPDEVVRCILNGEIIEEYADSYPYPAYLICCIVTKKEPLHVVCATNLNYLWIITVYRPDPKKWKNNFKTRRSKE